MIEWGDIGSYHEVKKEKKKSVKSRKIKMLWVRRKHHSQSPPTFTIFPMQKSILFHPHSPENKSCNNNEGTCE